MCREADSTFMLMAKCCHDVDLIRYIIDKPCIRVSSFGDLTHFRKDKRPESAAERCLDCAIEKNCPYSAKKIYLDRAKYGDYGWPVSIIFDGGKLTVCTQLHFANRLPCFAFSMNRAVGRSCRRCLTQWPLRQVCVVL